MSYTYPLTFPNIGIKSINIRAQNVVGASISPFTGQQQVYRHQGQWWEMEVTMPAMKRADAEQVAAFLLKMNGRYGTFLLGDPANTSPRGTGAGNPVVSVANQSATLFASSGWTAFSEVLKAGDWISIDNRLYKVLDDALSDGSGVANIYVWPNLRSAYPVGTAITINSPKGLWRLSTNDTNFSIDEASVYGVTFACVEAL